MWIFYTRVSKTGVVVLEKVGKEIQSPLPLVAGLYLITVQQPSIVHY